MKVRVLLPGHRDHRTGRTDGQVKCGLEIANHCNKGIETIGSGQVHR